MSVVYSTGLMKKLKKVNQDPLIRSVIMEWLELETGIEQMEYKMTTWQYRVNQLTQKVYNFQFVLETMELLLLGNLFLVVLKNTNTNDKEDLFLISLILYVCNHTLDGVDGVSIKDLEYLWWHRRRRPRYHLPLSDRVFKVLYHHHGDVIDLASKFESVWVQVNEYCINKIISKEK